MIPIYRNNVNIALGNGLLPDGTKPSPEPTLTNHQQGLVAFISWQFHEMLMISITRSHLKIAYFEVNFPMGQNVIQKN